MAVLVNATPASPTANSYITLLAANAYFEGHTHPGAWATSSSDQRNRALVTATKLIDAQIEFDGAVFSLDQRLQWPRTGLYSATGAYLANDVVPELVQHATAEFARYLLASDRTADRESERLGIKRLKAGPVDVEFDTASRAAQVVVPDAVIAMLRTWIRSVPGRDMTVQLVRC